MLAVMVSSMLFIQLYVKMITIFYTNLRLGRLGHKDRVKFCEQVMWIGIQFHEFLAFFNIALP